MSDWVEGDRGGAQRFHWRGSATARLGLCFWLLAMVAVTLSACGGPQFTGTTYRDDDVAFRVGPVPGGMVRLETNEAKLAFRDDEAGTTWAVKARCGLDGDDVPLDALVQHLFIHFTNEKELSRERFVLDGRAALEVEKEAALDGVIQHFIVVVTRQGACVYDFVHVDAGNARLEVLESRKQFRAMVRGFEVVEEQQ